MKKVLFAAALIAIWLNACFALAGEQPKKMAILKWKHPGENTYELIGPIPVSEALAVYESLSRVKPEKYGEEFCLPDYFLEGTPEYEKALRQIRLGGEKFQKKI